MSVLLLLLVLLHCAVTRIAGMAALPLIDECLVMDSDNSDKVVVGNPEESFPGQGGCSGSCSRSWERAYGSDDTWSVADAYGCDKVKNCREAYTNWWYAFAVCSQCHCDCYEYCREGVWTDWTTWSQCTGRCKGPTAPAGTRERSRACVGRISEQKDDCEGDADESMECMTQDCQDNIMCDTMVVPDDQRVECEESPSSETACTGAECCWDPAGTVACYSPPGRHEWVGNNSDWRYIKHLDAPDTWQYVNLTVRFDRGLEVALTTAWNAPITPDNSYQVLFNEENSTGTVPSYSRDICVTAPGGGQVCNTAEPTPTTEMYNQWANVWISWDAGSIKAGFGPWSATPGVTATITTSLTVNSLAVKATNGHAMIDANPVGFDTHWCWPGKSLQPAYTCECAQGWKIADGEAKCLLIDTLPSLETCRIFVESAGGELVSTQLGNPVTSCEFEGDSYMNFLPAQITYKYQFIYKIEDYTQLDSDDAPDWIQQFGHGIVEANMTKRIYSLDFTSYREVEWVDLGPTNMCNGSFSRDNPRQDSTSLANCDVLETYSYGTDTVNQPQDGEKFCLHLYLEATTYYMLSAWDSTAKPRYGAEYNDNPSIENLNCFLVDLSQPIHCTDPVSRVKCTADDSDDPCGVESRRSTTGLIVVSIMGWHDPIPAGGDAKNTAGIVEYSAIVNEIQPGGTSVVVEDLGIVQDTPITSIALPADKAPNAYDIHFTVKDKANNFKECRAVVFHDDTSKLLTNPEYQMNALTGTAETDYIWQINNGHVVLRWDNFFYNDWIISHNVLGPLTQDTARWDGLYHQGDGWVPDTGTHNINGVLFTMSFRATDEDYIPELTEYHNDTLEVFDAMQWEVASSCFDGEKFIMWKRAYDYRERELIEVRNIYIDSTPPEVTMVGVFYNGEREIYGISHDRFFPTMKFQFNAVDLHSNINDILVWFGTTYGGSEVGFMAVPVIKYAKGVDCPDTSTCMCPMIGVCAEFFYELDLNALVENSTHIGKHNELYHVILKVRNMALLETVVNVTILVDTSDPVPGYIYDGLTGTDKNELDFRTDEIADAHILGAYDHESGIRAYRWAVADDCLEREQFLTFDHPDAIFINTTVPFISGVATGGRSSWKVSAVVINNVMEPSDAICSDGVTVDTTPTVITEILVRGASVKPGLGCFNGSVWMIWQNRTKQLIPPGSNGCEERCVGVDMPELLVIRTVPGDLTRRAEELCSVNAIYVEAGLSLMRDTLQLEWEYIEVESQVNCFSLGVSLAADNTAVPDALGYTTAHSKKHVTLRHTAFGHGSTVYVHLKVENKAGLVHVETLGPVRIDETAPDVGASGSEASVTVTKESVCISWSNDDVYDGESGIGGYDIAIGTEADPEEMQSFLPLEKWSPCSEGDVGVQILTLNIQKHDSEARKDYIFTFKVYNGAGMFALWTSPPFQIPSMYLTSKGILKDVDPDKRDDVFVQDMDYTFHADELCFRHSGFNHPSSEITFQLGVGSTIDAADVIPFALVSNKEVQYCVDMGSAGGLVHLSKYYGLLTATTDSGVVKQHTDGVTCLDSGTELGLAQVHDGEGCFHARTVHNTQPGPLAPGASVDVEELPSLMLGLWYTVELVVTSDQVGVIPDEEEVTGIEISFDGVQSRVTQIFHEGDGKTHVFASLFARRATSVLHIQNSLGSGINIEELLIKICEFDVEYHRTVTSADVWWNFYLEDTIREHITHYEVALQEESAEADNLVAGYSSAFLESHHKFLEIDLLPGVRYRSLVRPCFASICFPPISSDGFFTSPTPGQPGSLTASAVLTYPDVATSEAKLDFTIAWDQFAFEHENAPGMLYAWTLSTSGAVSNNLRDWTAYDGPDAADPLMVSVSSVHHVFWEQELYLIVQGYTKAGLTSHVSARVDIQEELDYTGTGRYVHEVDISTDLDRIIPFLNSSDIGSLITWVHNIEIDYQKSTEEVSAFVTGTEHHSFRWRLVTDKSVTYQNCFDRDERCVGYATTNKNYHRFIDLKDAPAMKDGATLLTCIEADSVTIIREPFGLADHIPPLDSCSDGITIDTTPPTSGHVYLGMSAREQSVHTNHVYVHWNGFSDLEESSIQHTSGIADYAVSLGTFRGAEDIIKRQRVGRDTHKIFTNLNLQSGLTIFASVDAYNQVGLSTRVVSDPLFIDSSPPDSNGAFVNVGSFFQSRSGVKCSQFEVHWGGFSDVHSSSLKYQIAVGSAVGAQDKLAFRDVSLSSFEVLAGAGIGLQNGQAYAVAIKAINSGSLATVVSSPMFVCDDTAPTNGWVWDGTITNWDEYAFPEDVDYKRELNDISMRWGGFEDPESGIQYYEAGFGTEPGMTDIWPMEHVSTNTFLVRHHHLRVGQWYYATVRACNPVGLCHTVTSDGILYDDSPPLVGNVFIGFGEHGEHQTFLPSAKTISAHWMGFHDPHSGIRNYEFCVGTSPGETDVIPWENIHKVSVLAKSGVQLPCGPLLFLSLKAYNNVDLSAVRVSNPFQCDETAPVFTQSPSFDMRGVGIMPKRQMEKSQIRLVWRAEDPESRVRLQAVSVHTDLNGVMTVDDLELDTDTHLALPLDLQDELSSGTCYQAQVAACNAAGHCTVATTDTEDKLLVSSKRPIAGELFEPYPIAGGLYNYDTWLTANPMKWTTSTVTLYVNGFSDPYAGLYAYYVKFGTGYGLGDVQATVEVLATPDLKEHTFSLANPLPVNGILYVTIWVKNNVGQVSHPEHVSFEVLSSNPGDSEGILLEQKHSCIPATCNEDCTCAPLNEKCIHQLHEDPCALQDPAPLTLSLNDGWDEVEDEDSTGNSNCLRSFWTVVENRGNLAIVRFEWTFGLLASSPGVGIFDVVTERIWYDSNELQWTVHCLDPGHRLEQSVVYLSYVRVWYSATEYSEHVSDGIKVDQSPPVVRTGSVLTDMSEAGSTEDLDFTTVADQLHSVGNSIFVDSDSEMRVYEFSYGTQTGADDVVPVRVTDDGTALPALQSYSATDLSLISGQSYYATTRGYNINGFGARHVSDGITLDSGPPIAGGVYNGNSAHHVDFQASTSEVEAHWFGFDDHDTFILYYEFAIGELGVEGAGGDLLENVHPYTRVGIMTSAKAEGLSLQIGVEYVITVTAHDASGFSVSATSPVFSVDDTAPVAVSCPDDDDEATVLAQYDAAALLDWTSISGEMTPNTEDAMVTYMRGEIKTPVSVQQHQIYTFSMHTSMPCFSGGFSRLKIDYAEVTVDLIPTLRGDCEFWYRFVSQRTSEEAVMSIYSVEGLNIKTVLLTHCSVEPVEVEEPIFIQMIGATDVEVQWYIDDRESNIRYYEFTLGTTPGGSQLAQLSNWGLQNTAYLSNLPVSHNVTVYAMVIAHNRAGLETKFISLAGAVVDWTPPHVPVPVISVFPAGEGEFVVQADWPGTEDKESGVDGCSWTIGSSPGVHDLQGWTLVEEFTGGSEVLTLKDGQLIYATVQCRNGVLLSTYTTSRPTIVAAAGPDVSAAKFEVFVISRTGYAARDGFIYTKNHMHVFFEGITDLVGIKHYEVKLSDAGGEELIGWTPAERQTDFTFTDLSLAAGAYTFSVKAISLSGLESAEASTVVTYTNQPPIAPGSLGPSSFVNDTHLTLSWAYGFSAQSGVLEYDVNVGVADNAAGAVSGLRTMEKELTFSRKKIQRGTPFHVLVKAINAAGDFTIKKEKVTAK